MSAIASTAWQRAPLILLLASLAALGAAFLAQYGFGLRPCVLCLYQRWPYAVVIVLAGAALPAPVPVRRWLLVAAAVALLVNAGIAGFHVGVEQHWWAGTDACAGPTARATTIEELRAQVMAAPVARCDEVAWSLAGISMAGWNLLASLGLAGFALLAARRPAA